MSVKFQICSDKLSLMVGQFLTDTATVLRKSYVSDGAGGQVDSYTNIGSFPCSLEPYPVQPRERERVPGTQAYLEWKIIFQPEVVIHQTDRIECRSRTFEVMGQGLGTHSVANEVLCKEII